MNKTQLLSSSVSRLHLNILAVVLTLLFAGLSSNITYSQVSLHEAVWSVVKPDGDLIGNYKKNPEYLPAPQVTSYINLYDAIAGVGPNFRPKPGTGTQTELSVDVHPTNSDIIFASSNASSGSTFYGTGVYWSTNGGLIWGGSDNPPFGSNSGDPVSIIGRNGHFYENYITNSLGQALALSTNNGLNWTNYAIAPNPGSVADKNHFMADKKLGSPYEGRLYCAWTDFGGANDSKTVLRYSTNNGQTWSASKLLTTGIAGMLHQGVNIQTGPNGEVYAFWAVSIANWQDGEDAIGFNVSTNGGETWGTAKYIYQATNFGIRGYLKPTQIRVSSFPSAAVDISGGVTNGNIYVCWPQRGVAPAGTSPDIVMIRSTDGGTTFSVPVRVNDDPINNNKDQYYSWMNVDQATSQLNFVFYDARNVNNDSSEVYMARSIDAGLTFENFKVSDAVFKPKPLGGGFAQGYQGDYIGIASLNNIAYPYWMDDRTGNYQGWMSIVTFGPAIAHTPLPNTENLTGPYVITAEITSTIPLNTSLIKLYWGRGVGVLDQVVTMTNTSGNTFTASIPGNGLPSFYNYYIYAEDVNGGFSSLPGGAPLNYFTFEANTDNVPPVIIHSALNNQIINRWPAAVTAQVTDNIGVDSVKCEYSVNNGAITGSFVMPSTGGNTYSALFNIAAGSLSIGDSIEYRIRAKDNSLSGNVAYNPTSGYHKFHIVDTKGIVLVINDDGSLENRISPDKGVGDLITPLGRSASMFSTILTADDYTVDEVTFAAFDAATLPAYDIVILTAGPNGGTMFNNSAKRTALVNYTLSGGRTIAEGGELGYIYRQGSSEIDANFRRNILNDSTWLSDLTGGGGIQFKIPYNSIYNDPNVLTGPIAVTNNSYFSRDAMRLVNKPGVMKVGTWTTAPDSASIIIHYVGGDTTKPRNITLHLTVALITDPIVAAKLIENVTWLLSPQNIVPVELVSFTADVNENSVNLKWFTSTETNNAGFEVERRSAEGKFAKIGFVGGKGTTTQTTAYNFTDAGLATGKYIYRLKQVDLDGTAQYTYEVNADVTGPNVFALEQNYPNPFNPATVIKYAIPQDGMVSLSIYNVLGEKMGTLVNQVQKAGRYEVNFDASGYSSGIYFYKIESGSFSSVKKMMLMK